VFYKYRIHKYGIYGISLCVIERKLNEVLSKKKKTRYWLAMRTGISERNLRRFERSETTGIDFETLEKICEKLDCQPGDLLNYKREDKANRE
jgi:putative transcriptional regulator